MKQLVLMAILTLCGTVGVFTAGPMAGVAVYYLFAVLRPQYLWQWSLPAGIAWSQYVAIATILGTILAAGSGEHQLRRLRWTAAHRAVLVFALWVIVSFLNARNTDVAYATVVEYSKIFAMFITASIVVFNVGQMWLLFVVIAGALGYIGYEVNFMYVFQGFLSIYHEGYGGLDNNGAGLMLAMGVPLCLFVFEGTTKPWRWVFLAFVPVLVHAVLMSYSRGAMVSLLAVVPVLVWRSRRRGVMLAGVCAFAFLVPTLAGPEIQARFFTLQEYEAQNSAQSRFASWQAGWQMATENPITGVGLRNSDLFSQSYGADMENRTIHSQYLQIAADMGIVGLGLYLIMLAVFFLNTRRVRRAMHGRTDDEARQARAIACGIEASLLVFCVGALFLSLEIFELPYVLLLLAAQLGAVCAQGVTVASTVTETPSVVAARRAVVPAGVALPSARARYWARRGVPQ